MRPNQPAWAEVDRPQVPASYGLSPGEGEDDYLSWSWVENQLLAARNYWVASSRSDGRPHVTPVWGIWAHDTFYFSTGQGSRKARNLSQRPDMVLHCESGDDVVILEGTSRMVTEGRELKEMVDLYEDKYQIRPDPQDPEMVTFALRPDLVLAWIEGDFPRTATRWRRLHPGDSGGGRG